MNIIIQKSKEFNSDNFFIFTGSYFLSHSLSWSSNKENTLHSQAKVWTPEDPRSPSQSSLPSKNDNNSS